MEGSILKLYPQFTQLTDRRQQSQSVDSERRSGEDRRQLQRVADAKLNPDITKIQDTFRAFTNNIGQYKTTVKTLDNTALKNKELTHAVFAALSPVIPIRRISSVPDNIEDGNYARAAGLVALAGIMLPEDARDLKDAGIQIGSKITSKIKFEPKYDYREFQAPFSFFRGTLLEPLTNNLNKWGDKLYAIDKTIFDTKFGQKIQKLLKLEIIDYVETGRKDINDLPVYAYKLKGNPFAKLIGRSLLRTTVLGFAILSILETPAMFKALFNKEKNENKLIAGSKQLLKSSIYVISMLSGIGLFGSLLAKRGPAGSVIGMGIGSVIGAITSKKLSKIIDEKS